MRRTTTFLATLFGLLLPLLMQAQSGYNNLDFENWTSNALGSPAPTGFELSYQAQENTTSPYNGGSALIVNTEYSSLIGDTVGAAANGTWTSGVIGEPYTKRPDSVTGYIRYSIPAGDTGLVLFQLTKYDAPTDSTHVVGTAGTFVFPDTISNWTPLTIPFSYDTCATPDSISIILAAESNFLLGIGSSTIGGTFEADSFELHTTPPSITNVITQPEVCNTGGNNGSIEVQAEAVDSCSMYSIDGGATWTTDSIFTSVDSGMYEVIAMTANGSDTVMATVDSMITHGIDSVDVTNATCGSNDGSFTIHATGGSRPYEFSNDSGSTFTTDSIFASVGPGTYDVAVKDASGCIYYDQVFVGTTSEFIDNVNTTPEHCGQSDGTIQITASGGTTPYQFSIDNGNNYVPSNSFNNLSAGTYDIVVKDNNGCTDDTTVTLGSVSGPSLDSVDVTNASCGMSDGSIQVYASGGTTPYEYSNDSGNSYQASDQFTGIPANTYKVMVRDANMCKDSMMVTVDTIATPVASANAGTDSIDLAMDSTIAFDNTGSAGNSYEWLFGDGSSASGGNVTHKYDSAGTYDVVLVATVGNCTDSATVTVHVTNTTSLREFAGNGAVELHPNPSSGRFEVELDRLFQGRVRVMDLTGRTVLQEEFEASNVRLDLSDKEEGIYFVRLIEEDGSTLGVRRIVIAR